MKKILSLAAAALMLVSCNGNASKNVTLNDSVSDLMGEMYGYGVAGQFKNGPDSAKFDKKAFLQGLEMIANLDTAEMSKLQGMQMGMQVLQMQMQLKQQQKIDFNKTAFVEAFKKAFMSDSLKDPQMIQMQLMPMMERASREAKLNDPIAKKNKADGQAYVEKMVKEGYTKTASGLVYKMINEGTGETFNADQSIDIKYEGKLIDGKVFDATQGEETRSMAPGQVVPGFREALMLMKPGAKMIAVIPGDLAYGAEGRGDIIGPNATLVFTIETVGVHTAE
ncbi:MAG: FKBP-type peptidyl-prolyl cis-trans isomerase [Bacteroidales bacterium]|mgnify:CR=1 FL=1|nr:FKBP-type peptidyl-prolyl cis-trans isomerase [Bacteroidales bacterium]